MCDVCKKRVNLSRMTQMYKDKLRSNLQILDKKKCFILSKINKFSISVKIRDQFFPPPPNLNRIYLVFTIFVLNNDGPYVCKQIPDNFHSRNHIIIN